MPQPNPRDEHFLRHAIALSHQVRRQGKHPFAALVVDAAGQIVAEAGNDSLPPEGDPTRHAELVAAALAARHLPPEALADPDLAARQANQALRLDAVELHAA